MLLYTSEKGVMNGYYPNPGMDAAQEWLVATSAPRDYT
jgi:hypothetical protein